MKPEWKIESRGSAKRFDPDIDLHHHFQCIQCNRIIDFINEDYDKLKTPKNLNRGLKVLHKKVVLEGIAINVIKRNQTYKGGTK